MENRNCMSVERFAWTVVFWLSALSAWAQQYSEVAYDDCGTPGKQPHLVLGENYTMPSQLGGSLAERTCTFGNKVVYAFDKMDIQAKYRMEITFLADAERVVRLIADGNPLLYPRRCRRVSGLRIRRVCQNSLRKFPCPCRFRPLNLSSLPY